MQEIGVKPGAIVLEPMGRNTAPAAAVAALMSAEEDPRRRHRPAAVRSCRRAIAGAFAQRRRPSRPNAAREGHIVTFGMAPSRPETGYGYIQRGVQLEALDGAYRGAALCRKARRATATAYLADGGYFWNSGMFVFRADVLIEDMRMHAPDVLAAAAATRLPRPNAISISCGWMREAFEKAPNISIDYAVMEKTDRAAVVPCISAGAMSAHGRRSGISASRTNRTMCCSATSSRTTSTGSYVRSHKRLDRAGRRAAISS